MARRTNARSTNARRRRVSKGSSVGSRHGRNAKRQTALPWRQMETLEERRLLTADVFVDGLQAFQQTLNGLSQHAEFAESRQLLDTSFGESFQIGQEFGFEIVDPLLLAGDEATLVSELEASAAANPNLTVMTSTVDLPGGEELQVELTWSPSVVTNQYAMDLDYTGLRNAGLEADVTNQVELHATFGLTPAGESREFFSEIHSLTAVTLTSNLTHNDDALRGFVDVDLVDSASLTDLSTLDDELDIGGDPDSRCISAFFVQSAPRLIKIGPL